MNLSAERQFAGSRGDAAPYVSQQRTDKVEPVAGLPRKDGRLFVVLQQLVHGAEAPLPNAEGALRQPDFEVLVPAHGLQGDGEITGLWEHSGTVDGSGCFTFKYSYGAPRPNR